MAERSLVVLNRLTQVHFPKNENGIRYDDATMLAFGKSTFKQWQILISTTPNGK